MSDELTAAPIESVNADAPEAPLGSDSPVEVERVEEEPPQYGIGPFTLREVILGAVWLIAFIVSFFPVYTQLLSSALGGGLSVWTAGLDWILTIGVPTVAVFLIVLRRLSPDGIRRVGSLGVDQFASVAFSISATLWFGFLWHDIAVVISDHVWVRTWVAWVEFFLMLAGVVLTVAAPHLPPFNQDFRGRPETIAHRSARPVRAISARPPRPERESFADDPYASQAAAAAEVAAYETPDVEPAAASGDATPAEAVDAAWAPQYARSSATPAVEESAPLEAAAEPAPAEPASAEPASAEPAHAVHQAFWALAPVERDVYDEHGVPIFRVGPTAWALVIEDRGSMFVIRHDDGRIGYLQDVSGVTRG